MKKLYILSYDAKKKFKLLIVFMLMFVSKQCLALRCGIKLIDLGDHKLKVIDICGEPDFNEIREIRYPSYCVDRSYYHKRYRKYNYVYPTCRYRIVDAWIYNFGPRKFMRELIFRNDVIKEINTLDYGYN